jgi:elongation factor G
MSRNSSDIRNLALVGHGGSGKTTLCEALLKEVGLVTRVPAGVMDYGTDERERGHSIDLSAAQFSYNNKDLNVLVVPGYYDFFHNVISALSVVETAVIAIAATDGITVNTRKAWEMANKLGIAKTIVLTKLDGENVNLEDTVNNIQKQFSSKCIPLVLCDATGKQISKVENVLTTKNEHTAPYRSMLIEALVETDDALLNIYLEGKEIPTETLLKQLGKAIVQQKVIPILCVIPSTGIGVKEFLGFVADYLPSPLNAPTKRGKVPGKEEEEEVTWAATPDAPFSAQVFKIYNDPFGRLVYFRVYSGTLNSATSLYDVNTNSTERVASTLHMVGKEQKAIEKAIPGDIVVIGKVENIQIGDTLVGSEKSPILYVKSQYPRPMVGLAVVPKTRTDEQKIGLSLAKLAEEDATFQVKRDEETHEVVISGMSNLHLDIMLARLKNRFKVECTCTLPKIAYRETIMSKGESRYRHKRQTGGHGQFAEVAMRIEPTERGAGYDFCNSIVGGVITKPFVVSCDKGVQGAMEKGIIAGFKVVDVRVSVWDGKMHEVDSSDAAFQLAASKAFQDSFMSAKPTLLEPIMNIEITIPCKYIGDITGDLNSRRGRITGSDMNGDYQTIKAQVPLAEVLTYSADLKSRTGGEGTYNLGFSHHDPVPSYLQDKVIAKAKEAKEKEEKKG